MARKIKDYTDIGHGNQRALIWLFKDERVWSFSGGTHESIWGMDAMHYWRGRYEPESGLLSIVAPVNAPAHRRRPPQWLIDALEEKFGVAVEIFEFNPKAKRVKRGS